jgi:hypothetical protein
MREGETSERRKIASDPRRLERVDRVPRRSAACRSVRALHRGSGGSARLHDRTLRGLQGDPSRPFRGARDRGDCCVAVRDDCGCRRNARPRSRGHLAEAWSRDGGFDHLSGRSRSGRPRQRARGSRGPAAPRGKRLPPHPPRRPRGTRHARHRGGVAAPFTHESRRLHLRGLRNGQDEITLSPAAAIRSLTLRAEAFYWRGRGDLRPRRRMRRFRLLGAMPRRRAASA